MKRFVPYEAVKRNRDRKRRGIWRKIVRAMAAVVVFCTTYALIMPAITLEKDTVCGQEVHAHLEECYELLTTYDLNCAFRAGEDQKVVHTHGEACYGEDGALRCALEERMLHVHEADCWEAPELLCQVAESQGHFHAEGCWEGETLICQLEEGEGHAHQAECYGEPRPGCGLEVLQLHRHDETCVDAEGALVCPLQEVVEHIHDENCLVASGEKLGDLICLLPVHLHEDSCYAAEVQEDVQRFVCGLGEHQHGETCLDEAGELQCSIPEHAHSAECVMADVDLDQDVESWEIWDQMFQDVELTGSWPEDLLTIAYSQLDYRESEANCVLVDEVLEGYTRYGDCYGEPYGSWSTQFVRFCLEYADIGYYPFLEEAEQWNDPAQWMEQLQLDEYYGDAADDMPKAGDLMFLTDEAGQAPERIAIVTAVAPKTETEPGRIQTIQGDVQGAVALVTYELGDQRILGYGKLPAGYASLMQHMGDDYAITIQLPREARIPERAEVTVREILQGTEEYEIYYNQSVASLMERMEAESEEEVGVTFARFFDIGFYLNDKQLEPEAAVAVQIQYAQPIEVLEEQSGKAVHFAEDGIEILDADLSGVAMLPEDEVQTQQVDTFTFTQDSFSVVGTVLAKVLTESKDVWLDGTCGGLMAYEGSPNIRQTIQNGILPSAWQSPSRYNYVLKGWYDVTHNKYYEAGAEVDSDVGNNTVFYADWIAANYSIGKPNSHTVTSTDTSDFVTTYVFDYNALFNMQSVRASVSSNDWSHSETWSLVASGKVSYPNTGDPEDTGADTLNFIFRDHDDVGWLSHPNLPNGGSAWNEPNEEQLKTITDGIYSDNLGDLLFDTGMEVVGKEYLGTGNFLYQYDDDPNSDHYGYYYYDSFRNAASYNQSESRFYIYDYLEYSRDTIRNNLNDTNADFLPFNHPGTNVDLNGQIVYASQAGQDPHTITNFFFGIRSDIHFYLPNDAGATDANGNYLNKSTTGEDMIFEFSGDDDVWVLLDDKLLLDVGGIHMVRGGRIDFSQGVVYTTRDDSDEMDAVLFRDILGDEVKEGAHDLTIYYLERGSSMSNCAIYFNLAPRYGLNLQKEDYITGANLPGVTFEVYNDEACTEPAKLWVSHEAAKANAQNVYEFTTDANGRVHMWGFVAGKTYYIKETGVPDGYPIHHDLIRVTLNNHGTDISEVTVVRNSGTKGFEVTYHSMDKEEHLISMVLTNKQIENQLTDLRVEKLWGDGTTTEVPVQVYLMADGVRTGEYITLSADNAWGHTWVDLPVEDAAGNPIRYSVDEVYIPGYQKESLEKTVLAEDKVTWAKVGALEDAATFMIALDSSTILTSSGGSFGGISMQTAKGDAAAQWEASAYRDGFRLKAGDYYLTFHNGSKSFYLTGNTEQNQTFYYDGSQLFVMSDNERYYVAGLGNGLQTNTTGDATGLYKELVTKRGTTVYRFTNTYIPEEKQKSLRIEKYWEGDLTEMPDSILVHLMRNGERVTTLELSAESNWTALVDGLDGNLLMSGGYTLEEEMPFGFSGEVSQVQDISVDNWNWVSGINGLTTGGVYTFTANGAALADTGGSNVTATAYNGTPAKNQQWMVVETTIKNNNETRTIQVLKNMDTGRYLKEINQALQMVNSADGNCEFRLTNSRIQFYPQNDGGGWSLNVSGDSWNGFNVGVNWGNGNGTTSFTIYKNEYRSEYLITVTNTYGSFTMPSTGGMGTAPYYTFGILLILAAAFMYLLKAVCRRQKGGR